MQLFGLTGGIGMGKSAAADWFQGQHIPVIDTDDLARQVVEPGQPALGEIRQAFGPQVFNEEGALRREELARLVFADTRALQTLEKITHPRIQELWRAEIRAWRARNEPLGVVVIPLLYETRAETDFDSVICVACSADTQRARLLQRGWTATEIDRRIRAQWAVEKKMARADYVVWSEGPLDLLGAQLARILSSNRSCSAHP